MAVTPSKSKPVRDQVPGTLPVPVPYKPPTRIPLAQELKVRNLYLIQGLPPLEIVPLSGLTLRQVHGLIERRKWARQRRERERRMIEVADSRARESSLAIDEALASECEEIAFKGLERARLSAMDTSAYAAKDFQSWTGGVRALSQVARSARGLDQAAPSQPGRIDLFLHQGERVMKRAELPVPGP